MKSDEAIKNIVLAIETSVQGGSMTLLENEQAINSWQGGGRILKSEDILDELSRLLTKNKIKKNRIRQIVISRGPGSFTGTRIGLAIALGLKKSLDCDICGVSVLEAMALNSGWNDHILTAIPVGTKICMQRFTLGKKKKLSKLIMPGLVAYQTFIELIENNLDLRVVLYGGLFRDVLATVQTSSQIVERLADTNENLAILIGLINKEHCASDNLQPIYSKNIR